MPSLLNIDTEKMTTSYISNVIRSKASERYRQTIPIMDSKNSIAVGSAIMDDEDFANEYVKGLTTTYILKWAQYMYFRNPLAVFKLPMAVGGSGDLEYFIKASSIEVNEYDATGSKVDTPATTDFETKIHKVNSRKEFKATIYTSQLRMAFPSEGGMLSLIMGIVGALFSQVDKDEYTKTKQILTDFNTSTAFKQIATDGSTPDKLIEKIRELGLDMQFPSTKYISGNNEQTTQIEDLIVLTTPANVATIDVQVLANAFNMGKADWVGKVIVVDSLPAISNIKCLVGDRRFFNIRDTLFESAYRRNESGRFYNIFINKDTIYSASPFFNMCAVTQAVA